MDSDTNGNGGRFQELDLQFVAASYCVNCTVKYTQRTISIVIDYLTAVFFSQIIKYPPVFIPHLYRFSFASLHQGRISLYIGKHDGYQSTNSWHCTKIERKYYHPF